MALRSWTVAVTYEFDNRPPVTTRTLVVGGSPAAVAGKALRTAQKATRAHGWTSVLVLLERGEAPPVPQTPHSAPVGARRHRSDAAIAPEG